MGYARAPTWSHVHLLTYTGWMATVWCYPPEILPLKIRAKGAALAAAADFLGILLSLRSPHQHSRTLGTRPM